MWVYWHYDTRRKHGPKTTSVGSQPQHACKSSAANIPFMVSLDWTCYFHKVVKSTMGPHFVTRCCEITSLEKYCFKHMPS